jgi:hypothetical protein
VDALIDLVSHAPDGLAMDAVRLGGTAASTLGAADEPVLAGRRLTGANVMTVPGGEVIAGLARQIGGGTLTADVEQVLRGRRTLLAVCRTKTPACALTWRFAFARLLCGIRWSGPRPAPELARYDRRAATPSDPAGPAATTPPGEALAVLASVLGRDGQQHSATQARNRALADADHLALLHAIWAAETTPARNER